MVLQHGHHPTRLGFVETLEPIPSAIAQNTRQREPQHDDTDDDSRCPEQRRPQWAPINHGGQPAKGHQENEPRDNTHAVVAAICVLHALDHNPPKPGESPLKPAGCLRLKLFGAQLPGPLGDDSPQLHTRDGRKILHVQPFR